MNLEEIKKRCYKCGKVKPVTEFYKNASRPDGYQQQCKKCHKETIKQYQQTKVGRETQKRYKRSEKGKTTQLKAALKRQQNGDAKYKARRAIIDAVHQGRIKKPMYCEWCGRPETLHGHHHHGYDDKHKFDVVWLCPLCHQIAELKIKLRYQRRHRKWVLEKLQTLWLANNHLDEGLKKAEAEFAEAEKEIHIRAAGEEKEWERAEEAEIELAKMTGCAEIERLDKEKARADLSTCKERVRELEKEMKGLLDHIESTPGQIAGYNILFVVRHDEKNIKRLRRLLEAQAQTKEEEG